MKTSIELPPPQNFFVNRLAQIFLRYWYLNMFTVPLFILQVIASGVILIEILVLFGNSLEGILEWLFSFPFWARIDQSHYELEDLLKYYFAFTLFLAVLGSGLRKIFPAIPKIRPKTKLIAVIIFDTVAYFGLIFAFTRVEGDDPTLFLLALYTSTILFTAVAHYVNAGVNKIIQILQSYEK
ncbi:MAG TPA: hypothetical protein VI461_06640 [Chitinophagaceae bacterium]|nr:hypothetical protein [Chitinophagaceae bacterium]